MRALGSLLFFGGIAWAVLGSGFWPYLAIVLGAIILFVANGGEAREARKRARAEKRRASAGQDSPLLNWFE